MRKLIAILEIITLLLTTAAPSFAADTKGAVAGTESREVVVAMIDTGVDYKHDALKNAIWTNEKEIPDNGIDDDKNGFVDDVYGWCFACNSNEVFKEDDNEKHGTHDAGTIASVANDKTFAQLAGLESADACKTKVMVLKVFETGKTTRTGMIAEAIKYAEANGAVICNLSLAISSFDQRLYDAMANSKMMFVCSAGNYSTNCDQAPCYPACFGLDNIISVANVGKEGQLFWSSNYGMKTIDIAALGEEVFSTTPGNNFGRMSGTSVSAPFVSGALAKAYSENPNVSLVEIREKLFVTATKIRSLDNKLITGGVLDIYAL